MHILKLNYSRYFLLIFCALALLGGCVSTSGVESTSGVSRNKNTLRVGISANAPPLVFKAGNKLQGLEIDFAMKLGRFLDREIRFVELPWDNQIPSLEAGKTDIIMSGLTITPKRAYRVAFANPYMRSGQILLVRMKDAQRYATGIYSLMGPKPAIGTIKGTTGDFFITETINKANITRYKTSKKAVAALSSGKIDVFVHDAPIICHFAAINEKSKLTPILEMATEEYLAWAVNKSDTVLLQQLNEFIAANSQNNSLQTIIKRWIPYL